VLNNQNTIFKMADVRHFELAKLRILMKRLTSLLEFASAHQITSKSDFILKSERWNNKKN